jgi:hypothetical protein
MIKKTSKNDQIAEVIKEEQQRSRHPLSAASKRSRDQKMKIVRDAMEIASEEEFLRVMQSYGLSDEELLMALEAWREGPS